MNRDHIERHYPELAHLSRGGLIGALSIDPYPVRESGVTLPAHLLVDPWVEPERWAEMGGAA